MIRIRGAIAAILLVIAAACAAARPTLPAGPGAPFAGFAAAYDEAVAECRGARTILATLGLSGRAGGTRLRGTVTAAVAGGDAIRLEGVAFGRAIFILAGQGDRASLLFLREDRALRDAPPADIVEALAGVALTPAELGAAIAGCGLGTGTPTAGRAFGDDWAAVDLGGTEAYLRRVENRWRIAGATRNGLTLLYDDFNGGRPGTIVIRSRVGHDDGDPLADVRLRVSDLEINRDIDPKAFVLDIPPGTGPLTLDELRRSGPLGERR